MSLREDARVVIERLLGSQMANQVAVFEDPEKYPEDFLSECQYFLGRLIGERAAEDALAPLYKKYLSKKGVRKS